jgi:predicted TIM-barrel fold metal-dependent hydrolase
MRDGTVVADAHCHLFLEPSVLYGRTVFFPADRLIAAMDQYGIDFSLVVARPTRQVNAAELRDYHDRLAEAVDAYPNRLRALAWATPRLGVDGVAEAIRCVDELGYVGLKLHPAHEQFLLDDPGSARLIRVAADRGLPVMVHTQITHLGSEPWRLLFVAGDFPETPFLMAHVGGDGSLLQNLSGARLVAEQPNILLEMSTTVTDPGATYPEPAKVLGPERVLFGSNAPIHPPSPNLLKMDVVEVDDAARELMLGGNLFRLLKLD